MTITELTYNTDTKRYSPRNGGLPWHKTTRIGRPTKEEAYADAVAWAAEYCARDTMGNMAVVLGVIKTHNGWCGVVNYYHSNT